jgi:hypothetical protein
MPALPRDTVTPPNRHAGPYVKPVPPAQKPHLSAEQRQALELLASGPRGYTKARLLADGFTVDMLADLVREALATAQRETLRVGGRTIRVERYRITDAGRRAIEE